MSQRSETQLKTFTVCLCLLCLMISLWLFWANLFAMLTPDLDFPLVAVEKSRQIEFLIYDPFLIILSISSIVSGGSASNPKLENFIAWFCLSIFLLVDPLVEIIKELSHEKNISAILNERGDITGNLFIATVLGILVVIIAVRKKIDNRKN